MNGMVLAVIFGVGWLPLYAFRAEAIGEALPCYTRGERWAIAGSLTALIGHMTIACVLLSITTIIPLWRAGLALGTFAAGIAFWVLARALIGPLRVRRLPPEPPRSLRQEGPYRLVRNPMYFAVLVAASAPLVAAGRAWMALSYAAVVVGIAMRALQEERRLRGQLGPVFEAYARAVKRLIPFVW